MTGWADALKRARFKLIVFFLLAGLLVAALWPAFQSPGQPEDEGIALVYPEMFLKGRLPVSSSSQIAQGNLVRTSRTKSCGQNLICGGPTVPIWFYETSGFAT
jgi:hypothetical protein